MDTVFGPANARSYMALLTLFEISLFNKQAIKEVKSSALIIHREKLFEYFLSKELDLLHSLEQDKNQSQQHIRTRLFYALMYYAFEIKNNMHASISYYQKLKSGGSL